MIPTPFYLDEFYIRLNMTLLEVDECYAEDMEVAMTRDLKLQTDGMYQGIRMAINNVIASLPIYVAEDNQ